MKKLAANLSLCLCLLSGSAYASDLSSAIETAYDGKLESLYKHFHANPELSFREFETSARIAKELRALGFEVTEKVGQTGVVAVMKNGSGKTVMLRADMDGLPVKEDTGLSYASTAMQTDIDGIEKPTMHACGHDVHITSLIGAAEQLVRLKSSWSGTLVLVAQPAEERISGARAMMEDGLYKRFPKPDFAVAFHVSAGTPSGKIAIAIGSPYSSADSVDIYVKGVGAHGASPHKGLDPILLASNIVVGLHHVVSRTLSPREPGVITVGAIEGGTKHNIIGDSARLKLTVRSDGPETREKLMEGIKRVVDGEARAMGVPKKLMPKVEFSPTETTPAVVNHTETTERLAAMFVDEFGEDIIWSEPRQGMGAEDFAYFIAEDTGVKGVYFGIGGTPETNIDDAPSHHSPFFQVEPEPSIKLGTEAMVLSALDLFDGK